MENYWSGAVELPRTECSEEWVRVSDTVSLRVLTWTPFDEALRQLEPVVMIPGWGSLFEGWAPLVAEWATRRRVLYIETREKPSARFNSKKILTKDFTIERFSKDITEVLSHYQLKNEFHLFSSSLGSTLLIDSLQRQEIDAKSSLFVAPNVHFKLPLWARITIKLPLPILALKLMRSITLRAIEKKVKEEGQRIRYRRAVREQELVRWRASARSLIAYSLPKDLSNITVPCGILAAQSDKLYAMDAARSITARIPNAVMIEVPSNQYAHEADVLIEVEAFYATL